MASASPSSVPPSSAGSTVEDPDVAESDDDHSRVLERSSQPPQSSPASRNGTDSNNPDTPKRKSKMPPKPNGGSAGSAKGSYARHQHAPDDMNTEDEEDEEDDDSLMADSPDKRPGWKQKRSRSPSAHQSTAATTVGTRRKGDGTIGSVYSGNKIKCLKKDDGVPLWRTDIQYEFLRLVFEDRSPYFTRRSDDQEGCNFADIYIDAMARSSKTSKVLKDKLTTDRIAAQNMAMICLLVNVGRMNTTLNFFPEMKAQLRTYHSIPSLQAHRDQNAYKQLQDAPRLKSILKGASEDTDEPRNIEAIRAHSIPRTNPVNLIFVLSQYAPKISEIHFFPPRDFFDLVMKPTISSQSRASAFLWLMWWYLQSNFSEEDALKNPFGSGLAGPKDTIPLKVPELEELTEEQGDAENIDPPDEVAFGEEKQQERKRLLETDEPDNKVLNRVRKSAGGDEILSDYESRTSLPRASSPAMRDSLGFAVLSLTPGADPATSRLGGQADSLEDDWEPVNLHPGRGRYKRVKKDRESAPNAPSTTSSSGRVLPKTSKAQHPPGVHEPGTPDSMQAQPPGVAHPILQQFGQGSEGNTRTQAPLATTSSSTAAAAAPPPPPPANATATATPATAPTTTSSNRRPRPLTQHQLAVEANRRHLTETLLALKKREVFAALRLKREQSDFVVRAGRRIQNLPMGYDSEDEATSWGMGGLGPNPDSEGEEDDFGEEAEMWMRVVEKVKRRVERSGGDGGSAAVVDGGSGGGEGRGGGGVDMGGEGVDVAVGAQVEQQTVKSNSKKKKGGKAKPKKEPAKPKRRKGQSKAGRASNVLPNDVAMDLQMGISMDVDQPEAVQQEGNSSNSGNAEMANSRPAPATAAAVAAAVSSKKTRTTSRLDDIDKSLLAEKSEVDDDDEDDAGDEDDGDDGYGHKKDLEPDLDVSMMEEETSAQVKAYDSSQDSGVGSPRALRL